jgi:hypothetical protein
MNKRLSKAGREDLALALILLKDFKTGGRFDVDQIKGITELAEHLGVLKEYDDIISKVPPMRVEPRYK